MENRNVVEEARCLMLRLDPEPGHAEQVTRLAMQLFDQLAEVHQLGSRSREILEAAALTHDIGWSVSDSRHHKHSGRLIEEGQWETAEPREVLQMAAVARYHRKAHPQPGHRIFGMLDAGDQESVRRMAALLRIADGLDRTHLDRVERVRAEVEGQRCLLWIRCRERCATEIWGANRKKALFEEVFCLYLDIREEPESDS